MVDAAQPDFLAATDSKGLILEAQNIDALRTAVTIVSQSMNDKSAGEVTGAIIRKLIDFGCGEACRAEILERLSDIAQNDRLQDLLVEAVDNITARSPELAESSAALAAEFGIPQRKLG
jgi:hypothetical protein